MSSGTPRASCALQLDVPTRTVRADIAANRATLEAMRDGIQAVLDGRTEGYFIAAGSAMEPGSVVLTIRRVELAPEAVRWPQDAESVESFVPA